MAVNLAGNVYIKCIFFKSWITRILFCLVGLFLFCSGIFTPGVACGSKICFCATYVRCDHIGDIVQNALCFILNPFLSSGTINKRTKYGVIMSKKDS